MITINLLCRHCQSDQIVRNGHTTDGKQRYLCRACGRQSREAPKENFYSEKRKREILAAYREGNSLRSVSRIFGVSRNTLASWIKQTRMADAANRPNSGPRSRTDGLDLAELFSQAPRATPKSDSEGGDIPRSG